MSASVDTKTQTANPNVSDAELMSRMLGDGTKEKDAVAMLSNYRKMIPAPVEVDGKKFRVLTVNKLALGWTISCYYPSGGYTYLIAQSLRLEDMASKLRELAPDVILTQEDEAHSVAKMMVLLGNSYTGELATLSHNGNVSPIGCAVFVHNKHASYTTFDRKIVNARGLPLATMNHPVLQKGVFASYHFEPIKYKKFDKIAATMKEVTAYFNGDIAFGVLGSDFNATAGDLIKVLQNAAPKFAASIDEKEYSDLTFLNYTEPENSGGIDFVMHFGMPAGARVCTPCPSGISKAQLDKWVAAYEITNPDAGRGVPKVRKSPKEFEVAEAEVAVACEKLYRQFGSDHLPKMTEWVLPVISVSA